MALGSELGAVQNPFVRYAREAGWIYLSPDQARQMEVVLNDFVMYYQTLQEQMSEVRSSGKNRILQLLDGDQKQKFLRMIDQQTKQVR